MISARKIKILLLSVLTEKNAIITEELGICSIGACLREKGYEVVIVNTSRTYLDIEEIYSFSPDIVGIPIYSTTESIVSETCKALKMHMPNTIFVIGGYWSTLAYEDLLKKYDFFDYAIVGEGEIPFCNLANALNESKPVENIKSLAYRKDGQVILNNREPLIENLDMLPYPARDLLGKNMLRYAYISTSRGCMANCTFCWHRHFWGASACTYWRGRSPKNIVDEVKQLVENHGINRFWFIDNSFEDYSAGNPDRMWNICNSIIDAGLFISYETYFRAEVYRRFTKERMALMRKSGLVGTIIGIESGNEEDLSLYRKVATVEDNYNTIEYFRNNGIAIDIGFINFNPYSTFENLRKNANYLYKTKFGAALYYFVERCGITAFSDIYNKVKADGLMLSEDDTSPYAYRYVCEDIEKLSDFLYYTYHGNDDSREYFYAKKIGSIIREEFKLLNYIKRQFPQTIPVVEEAETNFWSGLDEVNECNTNGFLSLIDLSEHGWDEKAAKKIANEHWNLGALRDKSNKLEHTRLKLYMNLMKIGISPNAYFKLE